MGKMAKRRRRAKKKKSLSKLIESLKKIKARIPTPPTGSAFKTKKDYDRKNNKKAIEKELKDA